MLLRDYTDSNLAYRFVQENGVWYWKEIADSEYTQVLSRLSTLEATAEQLTSEYNEISVTLSDGYYTKVETDSRITQSASQIQTTVAATYATKTTTNSLQSQITQQASQISAKVSQSGGSTSSFGWVLNSNSWKLYSNDEEVFTCNSSGIFVKGTISGSEIIGSKITGGEINGVTIKGSCTMATNSSFSSLYAQQSYLSNLTVSGTANLSNIQFGGSFLRLTSASRAYAFTNSPSMVYSQELRGYVPVFSSYSGVSDIYVPTGFIGTKFVTT